MFVLKKKDYTSKRHLTINDLEEGNLFLYDGILFLMIRQNNVDDRLLDIEEIFALNLEENELAIFTTADCVSLIDKDIIIDYTNEDLKEWID